MAVSSRVKTISPRYCITSVNILTAEQVFVLELVAEYAVHSSIHLHPTHDPTYYALSVF